MLCSRAPATSAASLRKSLPLTRAHGCATSSSSRNGTFMAKGSRCKRGCRVCHAAVAGILHEVPRLLFQNGGQVRLRL
eukprot:11160460-Lingulodinium_polyedra.AAC.1